MKIKVGDVWENSRGDHVIISAVTDSFIEAVSASGSLSWHYPDTGRRKDAYGLDRMDLSSMRLDLCGDSVPGELSCALSQRLWQLNQSREARDKAARFFEEVTQLSIRYGLRIDSNYEGELICVTASEEGWYEMDEHGCVTWETEK